MVYIQHIQRQYDLEMETFSVNDPIIFLDGRFWDPVELIVYPSGQFQNLFSLSITRSPENYHERAINELNGVPYTLFGGL